VESPSELYEEQVSFIFAVAIQELQNRGFSYLLPYIQFEKPYPIESKRGKKPAVDIYFKIPKDKLPPEILHRWSESGVCEENWIEVKFFGGAERKGSSEPKTQNIGAVLADLLRLKYYVREGGRYLLLVFNRKPEHYLAFTFNNLLFIYGGYCCLLSSCLVLARLGPRLACLALASRCVLLTLVMDCVFS
jgi:hypothetical protein